MLETPGIDPKPFFTEVIHASGRAGLII